MKNIITAADIIRTATDARTAERKAEEQKKVTASEWINNTIIPAILEEASKGNQSRRFVYVAVPADFYALGLPFYINYELEQVRGFHAFWFDGRDEVRVSW